MLRCCERGARSAPARCRRRGAPRRASLFRAPAARDVMTSATQNAFASGVQVSPRVHHALSRCASRVLSCRWAHALLAARAPGSPSKKMKRDAALHEGASAHGGM
jgi:hypothetical protein